MSVLRELVLMKIFVLVSAVGYITMRFSFSLSACTYHGKGSWRENEDSVPDYPGPEVTGDGPGSRRKRAPPPRLAYIDFTQLHRLGFYRLVYVGPVGRFPQYILSVTP